MRKANIHMHGRHAGIFIEEEFGKKYIFFYLEDYNGPPVSLTMPIEERHYEFSGFPAFLDGLLPEGKMLDGLLLQRKIDRHDYLSQILAVGGELTGAMTIELAA